MRSKSRSTKTSGKSRTFRRAPSQHLVRAAVGLLVTTLLLGPFTFAGSARATCSSPPSQEWVSLSPGPFSAGTQDILDYAVSPIDPSIIYAANDMTVRLSTDGGCSFSEIFNVTTAGLSYRVDHASIKDLEVSWTPERAYVALETFAVEAPDKFPVEIPEIGEDVPTPIADQHVVPKPRVVVTSDRGGSWTEVDGGLEDAVGPPITLSSGGGGSDVYLLVGRARIEQPAAAVWTPQRLYGSNDSGSTWTQRRQFEDPNTGETVPPLPIEGIEADPVVANEVWSYGQSQQGLGRSTDGGATFNAPITTMGASFGGLSIANDEGKSTHFAFAVNVPQVYVSTQVDIFHPYPIPAIANSTIHGAKPGELAFSDVQGAVYYVIPGVVHPIDISDAAKSITALQGSFGGAGGAIYGRTLRTLERRAVPPPPPPEKFDPYMPELPPPPIPPNIAADLAELQAPRLLPDEVHLELEPGESETVTFYVDLPGVRKVDVAFLIDMSGSMGDEIKGLVQGMGAIADELVKAKVHAHFGVAGYRNYTSAPYLNYYDIGPPGDALEDALGEMRATGGGDGDETATSALYQIATGAGQDEPGAYIDVGHEMNFRADAQRLVIHGTDEALSEQPPRVSMAEAASALVDVRAKHAGLAFRNSEANPIYNAFPLVTLQEMSSLTKSFAPAGGINCGNGNVVPVGAPLVCAIPDVAAELSANMKDAIVEIVKNLEDRRDVSLEVVGDSSDADALGVDVSPFRYPQIDFKEIQRLPFDVTVTCPGGAGEFALDLGAKARGAILATSKLTVECRDVPAAADERPAPGIPAILPPLPRPPQFNSPYQYSQNPVTQAQAQTQAQSQAQAQAGLVHQRQEQPQVATVKSRTSTAERTASSGSGGSSGSGDMMMARYTPRKKSGFPLYMYVGGYSLAGAMGLAYLLATRTRRVPVRVRRKYG